MSSNINVQQFFTMKVGVNFFLIAILFTIFLLQAWNTISKYRAARTNLQVNLIKFKKYIPYGQSSAKLPVTRSLGHSVTQSLGH